MLESVYTNDVTVLTALSVAKSEELKYPDDASKLKLESDSG